MKSSPAATNPPDFSLILGGPLYQCFLRLHVLKPPFDLLQRRMIIIPLAAWLPLLIASTLAGRACGNARLPFLYDIDVYVRFLVALPLLILAEWMIHDRFRPIVLQFLERDIVTIDQRPRFDAIIES